MHEQMDDEKHEEILSETRLGVDVQRWVTWEMMEESWTGKEGKKENWKTGANHGSDGEHQRVEKLACT